MFCKKCGRELKEGTRFCPACGTEVSAPKTKPVVDSGENENRPVVKTEADNKNVSVDVETDNKNVSAGAELDNNIEDNKRGNKKTGIIIGIIIALLIIIAAAVGIYFVAGDALFNSGNKTVSESDEDEDDDEEEDRDENDKDTDDKETGDAPTGDSDASKKASVDSEVWAKAYIDYLNTVDLYPMGASYELIYLDNDDIPEIVVSSGTEADGSQILSYVDEKVTAAWVESTMEYIEKSGRIHTAGGRMGTYYDKVCDFIDGNLSIIAEGSVTEFDDEVNGTGSSCIWDNTPVNDWDEYEGMIYKTMGEGADVIYVFANKSFDQIIEEIRNVSGYKGEVEQAQENQGPDSYCIDSREIHQYEIIRADVTWYDAFKACTERGGHLLRISSEEEMQYITDLLVASGNEDMILWLGGVHHASSGHYRWFGMDVFYSDELEAEEPFRNYWMAGEPSYTGEDANGNTVAEEYMDMFYSKKENRFVWNDVPYDITMYYSGKLGYIIEFE